MHRWLDSQLIDDAAQKLAINLLQGLLLVVGAHTMDNLTPTA